MKVSSDPRAQIVHQMTDHVEMGRNLFGRIEEAKGLCLPRPCQFQRIVVSPTSGLTGSYRGEPPVMRCVAPGGPLLRMPVHRTAIRAMIESAFSSPVMSTVLVA